MSDGVRSDSSADVALVADVEHCDEANNLEFLTLKPELATHGLSAALVAWDDPVVDWSAFRLCVIRATWDYHLRLPEFLDWAERVTAQTALWNPLDLVRWNTHKGYLRELEAQGVAIVPTVWAPQGTSLDLAALLDARSWTQAVVKPAVSASAYATRLVTSATLAEGQAHLDTLLAKRDMMIQPFLTSVTTTGERSQVYFDGKLSHTILRSFALGDAVDARLIANDAEEAAFAEHIMRAVNGETLYARVDIARDDAGDLRLMELELVEPWLGLDLAPDAATRFAAGIARRRVICFIRSLFVGARPVAFYSYIRSDGDRSDQPSAFKTSSTVAEPEATRCLSASGNAGR